MKILYNLFISTVIYLTLASSIMMPFDSTQKIILQSVGNNVTSASMIKSADIITNRLKVYGLDSFNVTIVEGNKQIEVQVSDDIDISDIEGLLILKGDLAFYETLERKDFEELVKSNSAGMPLLVRSDVESVNSSIDKSTQTVVTGIKFKPEAIALWAEATRRNLNKHIAIVVDNQVLYSPLVRNVIEGGVCEITGNLSQKETNYFIALVNNEPLPVSFTILK